jgi:branched-chain amino acid transport system ATP-binding protein
MLNVRDLHAGYGSTNVLHGVSFSVGAGECVALVGANGAGKSTTLKCICGLVAARSGSVEFEGQRITGLAGHDIVRRGITMCPEGRQVFPDMSVRENLDMGAHTRRDRQQAQDLEAMMNLFPVLRERSRQSAGTLSGGEQEMLAIARALMSKPKLCIFDEPSLGLAPKIVAEV